MMVLRGEELRTCVLSPLLGGLWSAFGLSALIPLALVCGPSQAQAQTAAASPRTATIAAHGASRAPRHVSTRRETHPPRAPESSQGQVTNADATAPTAGIFPFIPPFFTKLPGAGLYADTRGVGYNTDNKDLQFRIGGRYQEDFSAASTSPRLRSNATTPLVGADGIDSRRAYFEAYLTLSNGISAAFQYDFANATQPIVDAVVSYHGIGSNFIYTLGNFKEPFSLNQLMSNNNLLFTERSLADAFVPARNFGGAVGANGERWTVTAGVFGGNINTGIDRGGTAGTARATYAPILAEREVLHLGIAGSVRALDRARPSVSISTNPEAFLFSTSLADTDTITDAASINRLGLEAAYQLGTVRVQAEYIRTEVDRTGGRPGLSFQGGYVEAGWVVNGRGRAYHVKPDYGATYAVFGGVDVAEGQRVTRGGIGVFELGARFSAIDLDDRTVRGGREWNATVGLNWYPEKNVKVMADYVRAHAAPASAALDRRRVDADIFIGRLQFYW